MKVKTMKDKVFNGICLTIVWIGLAATIFPLLNVISTSISSGGAILAREVLIFPKDITFEAYRTIFKDLSMLYSLGFTAFLTLTRTLLAIVLSLCAAYPLTKPNLVGGRFFSILVVVTMYFSGGVIPSYLLYRAMNITNTFWVLLIPGAISTYNVIVLKSFISNIPDSIEESAMIDGASHFRILFRIVLPLSSAAIATIGLFYAVERWNSFQDVLYYIRDSKLYTLQYKLRMMISATTADEITQMEGGKPLGVVEENLKSAAIIYATVPIILVYPWLQKYFVKGVTLGAVKG